MNSCVVINKTNQTQNKSQIGPKDLFHKPDKNQHNVRNSEACIKDAELGGRGGGCKREKIVYGS